MGSQREVVGVTVVARHGARSPNWSETSPWRRSGAAAHPIVAQWSSSDDDNKDNVDDNLTDIGREQMRAMGRHFAATYPTLLTKGRLEWDSSPAARCVESGRLFWEAALEKKKTESSVEQRNTPTVRTSYDRDLAFKAWDATGTPYRAYVDGLKSGADDEFSRRARDQVSNGGLGELWAAIDVEPPSPELALYWCCYVFCLLECERYSETKRALTHLLTKEQRQKISENAVWVWEKRFFKYEHPSAIGGALKRLVSTRPGGEQCFFRFCSAHDYSILALLAASGASAYDHAVLGFGACLVIEHFDDGVDEWSVADAPFRSDGGEEDLNTLPVFCSASLLCFEPTCDRMWREHNTAMAALARHEFLELLLSGDLPLAAFQTYIVQDALYLSDFGRALRLLADKCSDDDKRKSVLRGFADGADAAEASLHASFLTEWGLLKLRSNDDVSLAAEKGSSYHSQRPHTLLYTSFLLRVCALEPLAHGLAALLPCFVVYGHCGTALRARDARESTSTSSNGVPRRRDEYDRWINMYGGEAFNEVVRRYRALVEDEARAANDATRDAMRDRYATSVALEHMFWQQPLDDLDWPALSPPSRQGDNGEKAHV